MTSLTNENYSNLTKNIERIEQKLNIIIELLNKENTTSKKKTKNTNKTKTIKKQKPKIKRGNANVAIYDDAVLITGNTYDRKDYIKSFNAKWNAEFKGWTLSLDNYNKMKDEMEDYFNSVERNLYKNKNLMKKDLENYNFLSDCEIESDSD